MTPYVPALTRKKVARILASKAKEGGRAGAVLKAASARVRSCHPADVSRRCHSALCPDCLRLEVIAPLRAAMTHGFGGRPPTSLRRVDLRVPDLVPGDHRFRRCMTQLGAALAAFTEVGSPFRRSVLSFAGLLAPSWRAGRSTSGGGFLVWVQVLCWVDDEVEEQATTEHWRTLLVRKQVTDLGPWDWKNLVVVHRVRDVAKAIDLISRVKEPLPHNLAEVPASAIIEAFGNPRDLFHLYGRRTL